MTKKNYDFIDLQKSIAIYFVVLYHFNNAPINFINGGSVTAYSNYFLRSILSTCVPLFFFTNGALLLNKYDLDIKKHTRKVLKIILLTVIWGLLTLLAAGEIRGERLSVSEIIKGIFHLKQGWINHLWFLQAIVVIYVFFPLILTVFKFRRDYFIYFLVLIMIFSFGNTLLSHLTTLCSLILKLPNIRSGMNFFGGFNPVNGINGYSLGYFLIGGLFLYNRQLFNNTKYKILASICIIFSSTLLFLFGVFVSKRTNEIWDIVWFGYDSIFTLINVISIAILSLGYTHSGLVGKGVKLVADNSLGIYLLNITIGSMLWPYFTSYSIAKSFSINIAFASLLLTACLLLTLALKRIPIIKELFLLS